MSLLRQWASVFLIFFLMCILAWGISYLNMHYAARIGTKGLQLNLLAGALSFQIWDGKPPAVGWACDGFFDFRTDWNPRWGRATWFNQAYYYFYIPLWIPTIASLVGLGITLRIAYVRHKTQSRHISGRCIKCGYHLRDLSEPRCPECATEFDVNILQSLQSQESSNG